MIGLTQAWTYEPNSQAQTRAGKISFFPAQLTTSSIGNHTRCCYFSPNYVLHFPPTFSSLRAYKLTAPVLPGIPQEFSSVRVYRSTSTTQSPAYPVIVAFLLPIGLHRRLRVPLRNYSGGIWTETTSNCYYHAGTALQHYIGIRMEYTRKPPNCVQTRRHSVMRTTNRS